MIRVDIQLVHDWLASGGRTTFIHVFLYRPNDSYGLFVLLHVHEIEYDCDVVSNAGSQLPLSARNLQYGYTYNQ